jgi:hypothetical protein
MLDRMQMGQYHRRVAELRRVAHAVALGLVLGAFLLRAASGRNPAA